MTLQKHINALNKNLSRGNFNACIGHPIKDIIDTNGEQMLIESRKH